MGLIHTPDLLKGLSNTTLIVDTCTLVNASKTPEISELLGFLQNSGCALASVPPVRTEFLRVADTKSEYKDLEKFLNLLNITFIGGIEKQLSTPFAAAFMIALRRSNVKNPSYVDLLLLFTVALYHKASEPTRLITSNHKDIPLNFFDRTDLIVYDNGKDLQIEGIYTFNAHKFNKVISNI